MMHLKCIRDSILSLDGYVMQGGERQLPLKLFTLVAVNLMREDGIQEGT